MSQGDPGLVPGLDLVSLCAALYDLKPDQNNFNSLPTNSEGDYWIKQ